MLKKWLVLSLCAGLILPLASSSVQAVCVKDVGSCGSAAACIGLPVGSTCPLAGTGTCVLVAGSLVNACCGCQLGNRIDVKRASGLAGSTVAVFLLIGGIVVARFWMLRRETYSQAV